MSETSKREHQEPKHPQHMTTEEAVTHLFHPKVVEHLKNQMDVPRKPRLKKA
jgi:hypothetical protein